MDQIAGQARAHRQPLTRTDRLAFAGIVLAGLACLALLAWGHLGLGAWLVSPPPTASAQEASAGAYRLTLRLDAGQLTAQGPNTVTVVVRDTAGRPVDGARVRVLPAMEGMAMEAPASPATPVGDGRYAAHPRLGMAGVWRLTVVIAPPGAPEQSATFAVTARWR